MEIKDAAISASSIYGSTYAAHYARLRKNLGSGCWLSASSEYGKGWIQVDFESKIIITGVATQGSLREGAYVKTYIIRYSDDASHWKDYTDQLQQGRSTNSTKVCTMRASFSVE